MERYRTLRKVSWMVKENFLDQEDFAIDSKVNYLVRMNSAAFEGKQDIYINLAILITKKKEGWFCIKVSINLCNNSITQ